MVHGNRGTINLQATLSASSAQPPDIEAVLPHHPITCDGELRLDSNGAMSCEHGATPAGDRRTKACIDHSVALLLIELGTEL